MNFASSFGVLEHEVRADVNAMRPTTAAVRRSAARRDILPGQQTSGLKILIAQWYAECAAGATQDEPRGSNDLLGPTQSANERLLHLNSQAGTRGQFHSSLLHLERLLQDGPLQELRPVQRGGVLKFIRAIEHK